MAIRVALRHRTEYRYDRLVSLSSQTVRLRPAAHCRTNISAYALKVEPAEHFINWQQDAFGNFLARLVFPEQVAMFAVEVSLIAELVTLNPFDFFLDQNAEHFPISYESGERHDLLPYLQITNTGSNFARLVAKVRRDFATAGRRTVDVLVDINQHLQRTLGYDIRMEPGVFSPEETLTRGHGSCRDFAWLLVTLLRTLGIAARFVSGYSIQLVADQKPLEGPVGVAKDCTDLHAWAEAYLPGAGWIGLDATSGLLSAEGHIPLARSADPSAAAPITGSFEFEPQSTDDHAKCEFVVNMSVARIEDRPRPTRSYTEDQWQAILACGQHVDAALATHDVRLTMGGEPTFVSIDDMEAPEWNTEALGAAKAALADQLIRRLRQAFAPRGLLMHGLGKWYPGEQLPRWAYSLYFREDGGAVWHDASLISDGSDQAHDVALANRLIRSLAAKLGVDASCTIAGYEDVFYYLWRERRLPINVDPFDSRIDDELERARLRRVFQQGLQTLVGYALPLRANVWLDHSYTWETGHWFLRDERLYLLPGDSPMGYRLPLDALPWSAAADRNDSGENDPFNDYARLARHGQLVPSRAVRQPQTRLPLAAVGQLTPHELEASLTSLRGQSARGVVRTALCVEARGGVLHVFLPPVASAHAFLELIAKLEETARELRVPVRIEGYPPPYHPQLQRISVTPDPGVIEVNIHPANSWAEVVGRTTALYEQARLTRLGTDKFMLDGRHTGTGGGNHLVLGGATPADSPFLRRPDLLMSLVAFFNNHPALSYLFSGLFVGPTSQAPRLDEARNDSLYELDIARKILQSHGQPVPPWVIDRVLRHILIDVTGNTHRAEFCIDKLYNPDGALGRLGLLEMRAFEMPPDAKMSCAQQLLVRALIAHFWQKPYEFPVVRWGTTLHDRFALPHFIWQDLSDALSELKASGMVLDVDWFRPHWEFRFPRLGQLSVDGVELELRQAVEPWHVLGEEIVLGTTTRFVDASAERIQVLVNGMTDPRHVVCVAQRRLPLASTGRSGQHVAAVRYKAWQPPLSLHPTIPAHSPLVFDVYDLWNRRSLGGCTYHVSHPGGRAYDRFPTNGLEAESRRISRFFPIGHSPESFPLHNETRTLEHPLTLDLRLEY